MTGGRGRRTSLWIVTALAALVLTACPPQPGGGGGTGVRFSQFNPAVTGSGIASDALHLSFSYAPAAPRGELAVLFNGTGAGPLSMSRMGARLAESGFHVVGLRYESSVSTQWACAPEDLEQDAECHRRFRAEVVYGADIADPVGVGYDHPDVAVNAANSVVNRLIQHVNYMQLSRPSDGWEQFQVRDDAGCTEQSQPYGGCELRWDRIVPIGHSQGAGVALYLGKHHPVARIGMMSGAYDALPVGGGYEAAPWVAEGGFQVPTTDIVTFSHTSDPAIAIHRAVADALGLVGPEVLVGSASRPYRGSSRLVTTEAPTCPFDTAPSHNSTATDLCAPASAHDEVWRYIASGQ
jgi:hypothetical protein